MNIIIPPHPIIEQLVFSETNTGNFLSGQSGEQAICYERCTTVETVIFSTIYSVLTVLYRLNAAAATHGTGISRYSL